MAQCGGVEVGGRSAAAFDCNRPVPAVSPRRPFRGLPSTGRQTIVVSHNPRTGPAVRLHRSGLALPPEMPSGLASPAVHTPQRAVPAHSADCHRSEPLSNAPQPPWRHDLKQAGSEYARNALAMSPPPSPRWDERSLPSVSPRVSHKLATATLGSVGNRDQAARSTNILRTRSGVFGCYGAAFAATAHRMAIGASLTCAGDMVLPLVRDSTAAPGVATQAAASSPAPMPLPLPPLCTQASQPAHSSRQRRRPQINRVEDSPYGRPVPRVRRYRTTGQAHKGMEADHVSGSTSTAPHPRHANGPALAAPPPTGDLRSVASAPFRAGPGCALLVPHSPSPPIERQSVEPASAAPLPPSPPVAAARSDGSGPDATHVAPTSPPPTAPESEATDAAASSRSGGVPSAVAAAEPAPGAGSRGPAPGAAAVVGAVAAVTRSRARARRRLGLLGRVGSALSGGGGNETAGEDGKGE